MLRDVLQMIESADGPLSLAEMSRALGVDPAALEGMLDYWARKGRLRIDERSGAACSVDCATAACSCGSCRGMTGCPLVARLPRSFVVTPAEPK
jgi:hypothetical protein